ncbi:MAG: SCP2 sterol-binding domain-containing protein [Thioalkalispiraceae bacterium]|jgi:ubiquinone biosynthesis protein UbiJ
MSLTAEVSMALTAALETAINTYLQMDPDTLQRLSQFSDKVIAIELQDTGIVLYCLPQAHGITIMSHYAGEPDTTISGRPVSLARLTILNDTQVMFAGEVSIRGDVELGQRFKRLLENMDIDWEEHFSRVAGDVIAHKAGHAIREMAAWWRSSRERTMENGREYLQEEVQTLPSKEEVEAFYQAVETLRDDTARLAVRITQLEKSKNPDSPTH